MVFKVSHLNERFLADSIFLSAVLYICAVVGDSNFESMFVLTVVSCHEIAGCDHSSTCKSY